MTPERWQEITDIFEAALLRDAEARPAFLAEACVGDDELRREVEALIESHEQASRFIEEPAIAIAARQATGVGGVSPVGQTIGHYNVVSALGAGGMGDVYLALDTRLGRKIALKFLPDAFAGGAERVQRFRQEARAASALNHPNLLTVHDVGEHEGRHFIATEYVAGETLRARLSRSWLELPDALSIAAQVASALAAAHAAGITHRDIKPENIMIREDGIVKVLDFGIAKLSERETAEAPSEAPTRLQLKTDPGLMIGTVGYMSPEQARGREVDARTDIWSLGVVLYEMTAGRVPFEGKTAIDQIAELLKSEPPPLARFATDVPAELQRMVSKSLKKDREERYQNIKDLALDLKSLRRELEHGAGAEFAVALGERGAEAARPTIAREEVDTARQSQGHTASGDRSTAGMVLRHWKGLVAAFAALALAGLAFGLYKQLWPKAAAPVQAMKITKLTNSGNASEAAVSPDGKYVAYVLTEGGQQSIRLSLVDNAASSIVLVPPAKMISPGISGLAFSPDGKAIFYNVPHNEGSSGPDTEYALYQVPVLGGTAKKLMEKMGPNSVLSPDAKRIAFTRRAPPDEFHLYIADVRGVNERLLATRKLPQLIFPAAWSPDGQLLAYVSTTGDGSTTGNLVVLTLADGSEKPLTTSRGSFFRTPMKWLPDGSGLIFSAREQVPGSEQLWHISYRDGAMQRITNDLSSYIGVSLSADAGALVTTQLDQPLNIWVLPEGDSSRARPITSGKHFIGSLSWTPDQRIVYTTGETGPKEVSVIAPDGTGQQTLAAGDASTNYTLPSVSPDGRSIVFVSRGRVGRMDLDGGNQKFLTAPPPLAGFPQMSPDGQWVIYSSSDTRDSRLFKVSVNGGHPVQLSEKLILRALISPDGNRIACLYRETGDEPYKIAIMPFAGGPPVKVFDIPSGPGRILRWASDGYALYYSDERAGVTNIWRLPVETNGPPTQVTNFIDGIIRSFAWSRDGKMLAVSRGVPTSDVVLISGFK